MSELRRQLARVVITLMTQRSLLPGTVSIKLLFSHLPKIATRKPLRRQ
jgi:hypothetical protein